MQAQEELTANVDLLKVFCSSIVIFFLVGIPLENAGNGICETLDFKISPVGGLRSPWPSTFKISPPSSNLIDSPDLYLCNESIFCILQLGHMMLRGGMLNFPMSPQHPRFSSPQLHNRRFPEPRHNFPRNQSDDRLFYDNRSPRQQDRREHAHQHQFSDLERMIHNLLTVAEEGPRRDDPYAGLMTRREKELLVKIQLQQLTSDEPELDDYYFQVTYNMFRMLECV